MFVIIKIGRLLKAKSSFDVLKITNTFTIIFLLSTNEFCEIASLRTFLRIFWPRKYNKASSSKQETNMSFWAKVKIYVIKIMNNIILLVSPNMVIGTKWLKGFKRQDIKNNNSALYPTYIALSQLKRQKCPCVI